MKMFLLNQQICRIDTWKDIKLNCSERNSDCAVYFAKWNWHIFKFCSGFIIFLDILHILGSAVKTDSSVSNKTTFILKYYKIQYLNVIGRFIIIKISAFIKGAFVVLVKNRFYAFCDFEVFPPVFNQIPLVYNINC